MRRIYLPESASRARLREAEHARKNRIEIVRGLSWGRVTRRELLKMGLFTGAGCGRGAGLRTGIPLTPTPANVSYSLRARR
jgi:hypothetical protein